MSTNSSLLQIGNIAVSVVRKPIKNLHLSVLPPDGSVRVSSPVGMNDDAIRTLIATRIPWIRKQKAKFEGQERQTKREYVSGESHYFLGKRYRLEVVCENKSPRVSLRGKNKIILRVRPNSTLGRRERLLLTWYRNELRNISKELLEVWQNRIGVAVGSWGIKRMKTRWGTCNQRAGRIWLNSELVKKPVACIEYVVVHELVHLIEKKHNDRFVGLMSRHLPKWRNSKEELNRFMLSHDTWGPRVSRAPRMWSNETL
jgi:predicted metal-dependent hydrolase